MFDQNLRLEAGALLIAEPMLLDPNFRRAVVLICEHHSEGSVGFVVNQPLPLRLGELFKEEADLNGMVLSGGPVHPQTLHVLHRHGNLVEDAIQVGNDIFWGGSFEVIRHIMRSDMFPEGDFRFFLGYSGWGPGQLHSELERGGWILSEGTVENVFSHNPEVLWRDILRKMGGDYALLANFPDFPSLN